MKDLLDLIPACNGSACCICSSSKMTLAVKLLKHRHGTKATCHNICACWLSNRIVVLSLTSQLADMLCGCEGSTKKSSTAFIWTVNSMHGMWRPDFRPNINYTSMSSRLTSSPSAHSLMYNELDVACHVVGHNMRAIKCELLIQA